MANIHIGRASRDVYIEFSDNEEPIMRYMGDTQHELEDILDAFARLIEEHEELVKKIEEDYQPKDVDYYEEYGLSEDDFH